MQKRASTNSSSVSTYVQQMTIIKAADIHN